MRKFKGKTALVRIDLNIELNATGDMLRFETVLPTLRFLLASGLKVVILSHRGRPEAGRAKHALSLAPFAPLFAKRLRTPVDFITANRVGAYRKAIAASDARVILLENLRFFKGEEANDRSFAKALAACGDCYVNEAFPVCHRANASVAELPRFLPSFGGLRLKEEMDRLGAIMKKPARPFVAIIGGAKIGEKLKTLRGLLGRADAVLLGSSIFAETNPVRLPAMIFPGDAKAYRKEVWDIGPWTMRLYADRIAEARTVVWNGPVGFSEKRGFEKGTASVWKALLANRKAAIVVGGGETVASLGKRKTGRTIFLSTGGGAMLAFLSGKKLPGIEALRS